MTELLTNLASKEDVQELKDIINKQKEKIDLLESRVTNLENQVACLNLEMEENEQYSRRLCLRIEGISTPQNEKAETADDVLQAVKKVISECGVNIPDEAIDRAHRIGKGKMVAGKRSRQVFVRFTSFKIPLYPI